MKNKIIISDSEKSHILNMHESYKRTGFILEDDKLSNFPPCITKRNSKVSYGGIGYKSGDYIIIDGNKEFYEDGTVALARDEIYPYHCNGDEIVIDWDNQVVDKPVDCFADASSAARNSFNKLDAACKNYITSSGFEGVLARGNFSGWSTWPDDKIYDAILFLNNKKDLLALKKAIECLSHYNVTLDSMIKMGVSNWGSPNYYRKIYEYINSLK